MNKDEKIVLNNKSIGYDFKLHEKEKLVLP
jgi:hypothetical protein